MQRDSRKRDVTRSYATRFGVAIIYLAWKTSHSSEGSLTTSSSKYFFFGFL